MKKETKFKLIAITLPLFLVLLIEGGLRIGGYGNSYNLFNKLKNKNQPDYLVMNSSIGEKYFRNVRMGSDNREDVFLETKTDSTFRIFVQGASTVVGFPFYNGGSFPNMLKHRLCQTFPEKNIEVINTGLTAVNSYTLLDFTDEIIKQKPDVVIIYTGHNEYYGALGVGSTSSVGSHPVIIRMYLAAKNLRLFQLLENSYAKIFSPKANAKESNLTGMEKMVKQQRIPYNSKVYHAGTNQFEENLDKILRKYKRNNIPVIISTLVCNEKDIKPFISDSIIDPNQFLNELKLNDPKAIGLAEHNAMAAYMLGQYYLKENADSAIKYLHLAKELDLLRFRAPERINDVIVKLAERYDCHLVKMKDVFLNYTSQSIVGGELLTEHVHPNIEGYFVMADAFYIKLKELNLIGLWDNYITFKEAFNDIPVTTIDSLYGEMIIDNLKKSWPFDLSRAGARYEARYALHQKLNYEQLKAIELFKHEVPREEIMLQSYKWYKSRGNYEQCLRIIQSDIFDNPDWIKLYSYAGDICLKLGDLKKAAYYFSKYNMSERSSVSALQLANVYIKSNQIEKAAKTLMEAKSRGINDEALIRMLDDINQTKE